ncbi:MAG: hypothetical protein ACRELF_16500, partial [Gemmataceae bacterium]
MAEKKKVSCGQCTAQENKNYVSSLNSDAGMVDEINNFPSLTLFSRKSPWPEEMLILHLRRYAGGLVQLGGLETLLRSVDTMTLLRSVAN